MEWLDRIVRPKHEPPRDSFYSSGRVQFQSVVAGPLFSVWDQKSVVAEGHRQIRVEHIAKSRLR
jgi:hypothetical protein